MIFVYLVIDGFMYTSLRRFSKELMMMVGNLILSKCKIAQNKVILLGHEISENGIAPDPSKVECLLMMDSPTNKNHLMSFVQKVRYLSRSFCMLAECIHPLQKATQRDPFVWTQEEQNAFEDVKDKFPLCPY